MLSNDVEESPSYSEEEEKKSNLGGHDYAAPILGITVESIINMSDDTRND